MKNNKFKRVAAFAMAMTIIAGGSGAFNAGVGGLSNYTGIVASAEDYTIKGDGRFISLSVLKKDDKITVLNDVPDGYSKGIYNDSGKNMYVYIGDEKPNDYTTIAPTNKIIYELTEGTYEVIDISDLGASGKGITLKKVNALDTYITANFNQNTQKTILKEEPITAINNVVILTENNKVINWEDGKTYAVMGDVTFDSRITVTGTVNLILCDGATLTAEKGITVDVGQTLNIFGQKEGSGTLIANVYHYTDDGHVGGAAIGGYGRENSVNSNAGTIRIYGGKINASNDTYFDIAAIGGGYKGKGGTVEIYNGTVDATSNKNSSPGIGGRGDNEGDAGTVKIYGGTVNATGGLYSAGIGGSFYTPGASVEIYGGIVTASGGGRGGMGIGRGGSSGGYNGSNGTLTVGNGVKVYGSDAPIGEGNTGEQIFENDGNYQRYQYMKTEGNQPEMEINAPTITTQPSDIEVKKGSTSGNTLTVAANADTGCTLSYQWYSSDDKIVDTNDTPINGTTTYTVPTDTVGKKYYYCRVTATKGTQSKTTVSNIAEAGVYYEVSFNRGADDATGTIDAIKSYGGNVVLPAAGFTRNGYDLAGWKIGDSGNRIDANTTTTISDNAIFTAQWYKPVLAIINNKIDSNTIPVVVGYNEAVTLLSSVTNTDDSYVYTYQWYEDNNVIQGATLSTYTIPTGKGVGEHKYHCEVTATHKTSNNTITANSKIITFKVNSIPVQADEITADLVFEGRQTPEAKNVKYNDTPLNSTNDYDVEEVKDVEGNLCAVKIKLKGIYSGSKTINYEHTPAKEPTHNTNGNVEYWTYDKVNYIKENGKFKKTDNVAVPSDSTSSGIRVQTSRIEPTSEKDGYIITKIYCADCGKLISYKRVRIPKLS